MGLDLDKLESIEAVFYDGASDLIPKAHIIVRNTQKDRNLTGSENEMVCLYSTKVFFFQTWYSSFIYLTIS